MELLHFIAKTVSVLLELIGYAMLARALLPIFVNPEGSSVYRFFEVITEPVILPVRFILYKLNLFQDTPIDASFFLSYMLLTALQLFLPAV